MYAEWWLCAGFLGNVMCEVMASVGLRSFWNVPCFRVCGGFWCVQVMEFLVAYGVFRLGQRLVCVEKIGVGV